MSDKRDTAGKVGVALASMFFRAALYLCLIVLLIYMGQAAYHFGYDVFNQQAMSPGNGREITVVIQDTGSVLRVGKTLESKGLISNAYVFYVQELMSNYHGELRPGTYVLSTAYTPSRIMSIMAGEEEEEEEEESEE